MSLSIRHIRVSCEASDVARISRFVAAAHRNEFVGVTYDGQTLAVAIDVTHWAPSERACVLASVERTVDRAKARAA